LEPFCLANEVFGVVVIGKGQGFLKRIWVQTLCKNVRRGERHEKERDTGEGPPSPLRGEGKGEGKFQTSLVRVFGFTVIGASFRGRG
jgi:hypothetical protein